MATTAVRHPSHEHLLREQLGPGAPDIVNLRMPRVPLQKYAAKAAALNIDRAVLMRYALISWLEQEDGEDTAYIPR